jgi:multidrug efflux pump subunit AcrA (membrane-fusion protein)
VQFEVRHLYVKNGDFVRKGQLLASLNPEKDFISENDFAISHKDLAANEEQVLVENYKFTDNVYKDTYVVETGIPHLG